MPELVRESRKCPICGEWLSAHARGCTYPGSGMEARQQLADAIDDLNDAAKTELLAAWAFWRGVFRRLLGRSAG